MCGCGCNWSLRFLVWPNHEVVELQLQSGTNTALDSVYIIMWYFLPLLVFHRPLVLPKRRHPPSPLTPTPLHITPHRPNLSPTSHRHPKGHPSNWMSPGSHYPASLLDGSLVSPPESPLSTIFVSHCLPHVAWLDPLDRPGQPLIHAPLIALLFLHLKGLTYNKLSSMGPKNLQNYLSGRGLIR